VIIYGTESRELLFQNAKAIKLFKSTEASLKEDSKDAARESDLIKPRLSTI
jgi:hypothetical protein